MLSHKRPIQACIRCRNRKIRCTREKPECRQCLQHGHRCIYEPEPPADDTSLTATSASGHDPRVDALEQRVHHLERTVRDLCGKIDGSNHATPLTGTSTLSEDHDHIKPGYLRQHNGDLQYLSVFHWNHLTSRDGTSTANTTSQNIHTNPSTWAFFAQIDQTFDSKSYMPSFGLVNDLWAIYKHRVDPVIRILHKSTFERRLQEYMCTGQSPNVAGAINGHGSIQNDPQQCAFEALVFAMLHAAVNSLSPSELDTVCHRYAGPSGNWSARRNSNEAKHQMLDCFSYAAQQTIMKSNFLSTPRMDTLAAFCTLIFIRYNEADGDYGIYTCIGVLIRCARKIGLHVDPTMLEMDSEHDQRPSKLSPIDIELRRRLWHEIIYLDAMVSEPMGIDPLPMASDRIWPGGTATKVPSNVSDEVLETLTGDALHVPQNGITDMSLQMVRILVGLCVRYITTTANDGLSREKASKRIEQGINETSRQLAMLYEGSNEDSTGPVPSAYKVRYLAMLCEHKFWLMHHQWSARYKDPDVWDQSRRRGLGAATGLIESYSILQHSPGTQEVKWHTRRHAQLQATLHILDELCKTDPNTVDTDTTEACMKAWDRVRDHPPQHVMESLLQAGQEKDASEDVNRVWKVVASLKEQARQRWAPHETPNAAYATVEPPPVQDMLPMDYAAQIDAFNFAGMANTEGLDYFSLCQDLDASFNADLI